MNEFGYIGIKLAQFNFKEDRNFKCIMSVPIDKETLIFENCSYDYTFLNEYIKIEDYINVLNICTKTMHISISKKRIYDKYSTPFINKLLGGISVLLLICYIFTIYYAQSRTYAKNLFNFSVFCLITGISILLYNSLSNFCREMKKYYILEDFFKNNMTAVVNEINFQVSLIHCRKHCFKFYDKMYCDNIFSQLVGNKELILINEMLCKISDYLVITLKQINFSEIKCYFYYNSTDRTIEIFSFDSNDSIENDNNSDALGNENLSERNILNEKLKNRYNSVDLFAIKRPNLSIGSFTNNENSNSIYNESKDSNRSENNELINSETYNNLSKNNDDYNLEGSKSNSNSNSNNFDNNLESEQDLINKYNIK